MKIMHYKAKGTPEAWRCDVHIKYKQNSENLIRYSYLYGGKYNQYNKTN